MTPVVDLDDTIPDDVRDRQRTAVQTTPDADLWVTDVPVCLHCGAANLCAYGGGKATLEVDGHTLVAETCADCGQETVHILEVDR